MTPATDALLFDLDCHRGVVESDPVTRRGGDDYRVTTGDAATALRAEASASVDCIVTSPPYYNQRDYGVPAQIGLERTVDHYLDRLADVFTECHRILRPRGVLWVNIGDTYNAYNASRGEGTLQRGRKHATLPHRPKGYGLTDPTRPNKALLNVPARFAERMAEIGWLLRSDAIWKKAHPMPGSSQDRPRTTYEHVYLFTKRDRYYFDRAGLGGDEDVWVLPATDGKHGGHTAAYPEALASRCVRSGCIPGGVVLDPFAGSGSTGAAALAFGCSFVGVELDSRQAAAARRRLERTPRPRRVASQAAGNEEVASA